MSPVTAAAWAKEPLPPWLPSSMYFLALSQAPPAEVIAMPTKSPVTIVPISKPPSASMPMNPTPTTKTKGNNAGRIICFKAACVTMSTH